MKKSLIEVDSLRCIHVMMTREYQLLRRCEGWILLV